MSAAETVETLPAHPRALLGTTSTASASGEVDASVTKTELGEYTEENPYHLVFAFVEFYEQDDAARTAVQDALNEYMIPKYHIEVEFLPLQYAEYQQTIQLMISGGDELDVIKKGELIEGMEANQFTNIENSQYRESIEEIVNSVMVTDQQGNITGYQTKDEWIKRYSMVQDVYKTNPNDNAQTEINKLFKGPERSGIIQMMGNYAAKSSYSIQIRDILTELSGKFWIKSDTHTLRTASMRCGLKSNLKIS